MKDSKYILANYTFYDRTGIQTYLEQQAAKGWLLDKADTVLWRFRRIEPKKLHFSVVYFPGADVYDPEPGEEEQTFREFCAHGGWTLAGSNAQMQIFWTDREDPMPIETDPVMEVENIHRSMKKSMLTAYWILVANGILQLGMQILYLTDGVLAYLSSHLRLSLAVLWFILLVIGVWRLIAYYTWRKRAKRAAEEDGIFIPTKSMAKVELIVSILVFGGLIGLVFTMDDRRMQIIMAISLTLAFVLIALVEGLRRKLKREGYEKGANKTATILVSVVLSLVLCFVAIPIVSSIVLDATPNDNDREPGLLLTLSDLQEDVTVYDTFTLTDQESFLLGYQRVHQVPNDGIFDPRLQYNLAHVRAKFLYGKCLEEMMAIPVYMTDGKFLTADPAPWGAESAWQMHDGEELRQWYVLCYEDYILEIIPSWEPDARQMQTVGEIFG